MNKLQVSFAKTLKLSNVLIKKFAEDEFENIEIVVEQMDNYIKSKGHQPMGPLIQYTSTKMNDEGEIDLVIKLMRQSGNFINRVEGQYVMEPVIRVKNCLYVRYTGPEQQLKLAYDKINLTAFEEDIKLKGDSYTIFVDQQDDIIIADVFMECAHE